MVAITDRSDAIDLQWTPLQGPPRKLSFRPRSDGLWTRVSLRWSGCRWVETGAEIVDDVELEAGGPRIK